MRQLSRLAILTTIILDRGHACFSSSYIGLFILVDDREEEWLILDTLRLNANTAVVFSGAEPIRDFWRQLLTELLVDMPCLPDLVNAHIFVETRHLFGSILHQRVVPREEGWLHIRLR